MTARLVDVQYHNLLDELCLPSRRGRQSSMDGRAEIRGSVRSLPPPISSSDRTRKSGGNADPAPAASALDPFHASPKCRPACAPSAARGVGSYANEAERLTGKVLERLRYDTIDEIFRAGLARLSERDAANVRRDRREISPAPISTTRWWHEPISSGPHDGIPLRRRRFRKATTKCACGRSTTSDRAAFRFASITTPGFARHLLPRRLRQLGAPIQYSSRAPPPADRGGVRRAGPRIRPRPPADSDLVSPNSIRAARIWEEEHFDFLAPTDYVPHLVRSFPRSRERPKMLATAHVAGSCERPPA